MSVPANIRVVDSKSTFVLRGWTRSYQSSDVLVGKSSLNMRKVCVDMSNKTAKRLVLHGERDQLFQLCQVLAANVLNPPLLVQDLAENAIVVGIRRVGRTWRQSFHLFLKRFPSREGRLRV